MALPSGPEEGSLFLTSFLPAPASQFSQSLVPSCHCLLLLFSFSPFPFTVNPQWRNNGLNPISENNATTPISSQPLAFAVESFVDNISEELGEAGRVWSKQSGAFPCAPQHQIHAWMWSSFGHNPESPHILWPLWDHPNSQEPLKWDLAAPTGTLSSCSHYRQHRELPPKENHSSEFQSSAQQQNCPAPPHWAVHCSVKYNFCFISLPKLLKPTPNPAESRSC